MDRRRRSIIFLIKISNRPNVALSIKSFYEIKCSNLSIDPEIFFFIAQSTRIAIHSVVDVM